VLNELSKAWIGAELVDARGRVASNRCHLNRLSSLCDEPGGQVVLCSDASDGSILCKFSSRGYQQRKILRLNVAEEGRRHTPALPASWQAHYSRVD
jgi:hypothetical protein